MTILVLDASVIVKFFAPEEPGAEQARQLIDAASNRAEIVEPTLMLYEAAGVLRRRRAPLQAFLDIIDHWRAAGLEIVECDPALFLRAEEMAKMQSDAGAPTLLDCLYHALAERLEGTLITADARHIARTKLSLGRVCALNEWETLF